MSHKGIKNADVLEESYEAKALHRTEPRSQHLSSTFEQSTKQPNSLFSLKAANSPTTLGQASMVRDLNNGHHGLRSTCETFPHVFVITTFWFGVSSTLSSLVFDCPCKTQMNVQPALFFLPSIITIRKSRRRPPPDHVSRQPCCNV